MQTHSVVGSFYGNKPYLMLVVAFLLIEVVVAFGDASLEYFGEIGEGVDGFFLVEVIPVLEDV